MREKLIATVFEEVRNLVPMRTDPLKSRLEEKGRILIVSLQGKEKRRELHRLNRTASEVLNMCDGRRTIDQIVQEMSQTYAQTKKGTVTEDVISAIRVMEEKGLVRFESQSISAECDISHP